MGRTVVLAATVIVLACLAVPQAWATHDLAAKARVDERRVYERIGGEQHTPATRKWLAGRDDLAAYGDFDGDGAVDSAFFVRVADGYALAVSLGGAEPVAIGYVQSIAERGIATAPPGRYIAACALGYGRDCAEGGPSEVTTTRDSIKLVWYEASSVLYYFREGRFEKMWLSD